MTGQMVVLLGGLFFAHYLGDFTPLVTRRMLEAKSNGSPMLPIFFHAGVHAVLITCVILVAAFPAWKILLLAAAIEFFTHFAIDAGRAALGQRFPDVNNPGRSAFWHLLGVDQFAHAAVLIFLAALVL